MFHREVKSELNFKMSNGDECEEHSKKKQHQIKGLETDD